MFSVNQKEALSIHLKKRFMSGEVEGHEIVVALLAMVEAGNILLGDIKNIMMSVFFENHEGVMRALLRAHQLVDDVMIDQIIREVKPQN